MGIQIRRDGGESAVSRCYPWADVRSNKLLFLKELASIYV